MDRTHFHVSLFYSWIIILLLFAILDGSTAADNTSTVTRTQYISEGQTITSYGKTFMLGFFKPGTPSNRYLGIWYTNIKKWTVVWVANRDNPITTDSPGVVRIADDGNLVILDGKGSVVWSTNVTVGNNSASSSVIAELLDTGNLVLRQQTGDRKILWQSFDFPTDTLLPTMKLGVNRRTGKNIQLTSWKEDSDPSIGVFSVGIDLIDINITQIVIRNGSHRIWRSGPWNNDQFLGTYLQGLNITRDPQGDGVYVTFSNDYSLTRYVLDHSGEYREESWNERDQLWRPLSSNSRFCTIYNRCAHNSICTPKGSSGSCACMTGYKSERETLDSFSSVCRREKKFQCESTRSSNGTGNENDADKFIEMDNMKPPDFPTCLTGPKNSRACADECLRNCSCLAYSYANGIGCMTWGGRLVDVTYGYSDRVKLYVRVNHTQAIEAPSSAPESVIKIAPETAPAKERNKRNSLIIIPVVIGTFAIIACTYFCWRWRAKQRGRDRASLEIPINVDNEESSDPDMLRDNIDLKIFKFENVVTATNNFCASNKLGEGGFGPVYKGKFADDGQEIAVKRLSKCSLQGFQEFKNEVLVILKLQHRNLVKLLGCCMEGEERLLIYEYMPNKSLDAFIFDSKKQALLDWRKRFQIIEGICRGVIYLHRDSRLRVIHRDLKASNILLDEELNPKISDFGMARIFGSNELQANTRRVVGTYGYMSPEYAMDGLFSEKSDVFSFGVLLLEIVSGKRNSNFYNHELSSSLLEYAWQLWNDNQTQLLIDPTLSSEPNSESEILRCIHVGLLCVQDSAKDRPTMYTALSMLISEISSLPTPKQPAFNDRSVSSDSNPSQINHIYAPSRNNLTISVVEGR